MFFASTSGDRQRRSLFALLCLAFVLLFGATSIAEAGHAHDGQSPDSYKNCSVCAGAHVASSAVASAVQHVAPAHAASVLVQQPLAGKASCTEESALFGRSPPAV